MPRTAVLVLLLACAALGAQAQSSSTEAFGWLQKNAKTMAAALDALGIRPASVPASTVGTLLVPSDKAFEAFFAGMKLSPKEVLARKALVDQVLAFHFIPNYQAKSIEDVPSPPGVPTVAVTGDENYVLRFYRNAAKDKVWVQDTQGNNVTLTAKPVIFSKISIVPIDRVLMSGGYFFTGSAALAAYPQWSDAFEAAKLAGWPAEESADITMFVPENAALAKAKSTWAGMSREEARKQLTYHFIKPAQGIPGIRTGRVETLLPGHYVTIDVKKGSGAVPEVTITPEVGAPARVVIYNIFVGRGIFQGLNGNIQAKLAPAAAAAGAKAAGRKLLARGGPRGDTGYNQMAANSIAATNTQQAINAAAEGRIPTGAATRYGSYQASEAAAYSNNNYCYNCGNRSWRG